MNIIDEGKIREWLAEDPNYREPGISGSVLSLPAAELLVSGGSAQAHFRLQELPDNVAEALEKHTGDLGMNISSLTPFAARCLAQRKYRKNTNWRLYLTLDRLEAAEAAELAKTRYPLILQGRGGQAGGVMALSDEAAEVLAEYEGECLDLMISELSDSALEALSRYQGDLDLNNLTRLSDAAAESLCKHQGDLRIGIWLESCSDAAREALSRKSGTINGEEPEQWAIEQMMKQELSEISDAAAEMISRYQGEQIALNTLTTLSDTAAKALSKVPGGLSLDGLKKLSDAAAESLSKHRGDELILSGLTELSDAAAESFSKHKEYLSLDGLTELSDAAAESLSKHKGDLSLNGLNGISDTAAISLSSYKGQICFQTPNDWVEFQKYRRSQG